MAKTRTLRKRPDQPSGPISNGFPVRLQRVAVVGEGLAGRADEGITKFGLCLAEALRRRHAVRVLATRPGPGNPGVTVATAPPTLLSRNLRQNLRAFEPDIVIYVPSASATLWSFARAAVLRTYCPHTRVVLVSLQPRGHGKLARLIISALAPDIVCVPSESSRRYFEGLGCRARVVPPGVDLDRFRPLPAEARAQLRLAYGFDLDPPVVLHAGHLKAGRGVGVLGELARTGACQVVLLASSSTAPDDGLAAALQAAGVKLVAEFRPDVERYYQLADCYVFPVRSADDSIELPLSVLEALACDLPLVTTRFGPLPSILPSGHPAIRFADTPEELVAAVIDLCRHGPRVPAGTRRLTARFSWDTVANRIVEDAISAR
jgi:glycosyltransferase involved in cell wall biosynthesis